MESEWAVFKASIAEVAGSSCGQKVIGDWWTPAVKETFKLKKEAFQVWLAQGSLEAGDRPEGLQLLQFVCVRSSGKLWRSLGWPQGSADKPFNDSGRKSRAWLRLYLAGGENC